MNLLEKLDEEKYFLIAVFILALTIRFVVFIGTGNHNADGAHRTILTVNWLKDPYFITEGLWPPLDLYLMAFMMELWKNPLVSPRLVNLALGVLTVIPYYYLVKLLFDKKTAVVSTLLLTFLGLHIQLSTVSMSEVPLLLFLLISLYFFYRFKKAAEKKTLYLFTSAIFLNLASMVRYEAWLFIPILTVFILNNTADVKNILCLKNQTTKYLFIFFIVSLIFPLFWMIGNYRAHGDFFYSQTWAYNFTKTNAMIYPDSSLNINPPFKKLILWPVMLLQNLNIIPIFACIGFLVSVLLKKKNMEFVTIFMLLMLVFTYNIFNFTMSLQTRYLLLPSVFLIPYFTVGLNYLLKSLNNDRNKTITAIIILFFITTSSYSAILKNPYVTPSYVFDVSNWLKTNVKPNEKILLDEYDWWGLHILLYSGFNTTFTENYLKTFEFATDQIRIVPGGGKLVDKITVMGYLENDKPTYVVYSPGGELAGVLNLSPECKNEIRLNYTFECKYSTKNYNIYKLKPIYNDTGLITATLPEKPDTIRPNSG